MKKILNKNLKEKSKIWIGRQLRDTYAQKAKSYNLRSRSAFKLIEIDKKFKFLKHDISLLDLGSAPGGWSLVVSRKIKKGKFLAVDIIDMQKIKNISFILGNFLNSEIQKKINNFFESKIDVVISDMAANTTGNKHLDSYRTNELCIEAMKFSQKMLKINGVFICKCFMGSEFETIQQLANTHFKQVVKFKPDSSRKESRELYIYCKHIVKQL